MKAFLVGLLVILGVSLLAGLGVLLFPFLLVLGFAIRILVLVLICLFSIWLVGKLVLILIDALKRKEQKSV
ncbi:MAG: hypothetical protein BWY42_01226 [Candidatus Omnitrophica bacterium ADurb.Bin277]|nr:MAG: hypothetical protein BWY42_01226 [Candidatus Omnitrophica bacterium ADurb.Bin277]